MRIGVTGDLHLGHSGEGRWHNRLLFDRAEEIARSAVAVLNRQGLDAVVVLGDLTQAGTEAALTLACGVLSDLSVPWVVIPGNHDRPAVQSGQFDEVFSEHLPGLYSRRGDIGMLFLREGRRDGLSGPTDFRLGAAGMEAAVRAVEADRPETLIAFSHIPLFTEQPFADEHAGNYAGHYADGPELLARLQGLVPGRVVVLCAHQHWHHVLEGPGWLQCTTGALVEYPMEVRLVSIEGRRLRVSVVAGAAEAVAAESLQSANWVRGNRGDRICELHWPAR